MSTLAETIAATLQTCSPTESLRQIITLKKDGMLCDDPVKSLALALIVADAVTWRGDEVAPASGTPQAPIMMMSTMPDDDGFVVAAQELVDIVNGGLPPELNQRGEVLGGLFARLLPLFMPIIEKIIADLISRWLAPDAPN